MVSQKTPLPVSIDLVTWIGWGKCKYKEKCKDLEITQRDLGAIDRGQMDVSSRNARLR